MSNTLGIKSFDFVEFYVGSAKMVAYWYVKALGFDIEGYSGPEYGNKSNVSYFLKKNNLKFVVTSYVKPENYEVLSFVNKHGDGVKRFAYLVEDVDKAFNYVYENKAVPIKRPTKIEDESGYITEASVKAYDDTEIVFINYDNYNGIFKPGFGKPRQNLKIQREETYIEHIDHIVGNVRWNEMDLWVNYFNKSFDFETFVDFGPGDISTPYSSLISKVVRSKDNVIKMPVNEPYIGLKKSQIEEYIQEYNGTGVQHIAIFTKDILKTIEALRNNGVEFLHVPSNYYDELRKKKLKIDENIDDLERLGILLDFEGEGYLLQLFTKPIGDRPTFFFEFIQRKGKTEGFGHGNFQALFESIEREQALRGNL